MAKKKNNGKAAVKPLKPEDYLRTRVRALPIYKCYKAVNLIEDREMCIVVVRRHPQGTFSCGAYMIDKWCLGVKDTIWRFSISEEELEEFLSFFKDRLDNFDEIDYVEAHNWVYGAVAFAEDAGIKPCGDFAVSKYLLAEDDENTELIEYEFGRDGEYCLVTKTYLEASKYIPVLDRNLGKGNYTVETGGFDGWDEDEDDDGHRTPFESTPEMEYTYKGGNYPEEIILNYPETEEIVVKDTEDISDEDIGRMLSLKPAKLREDLQNIVLRELGRQWDKPEEDLELGEWNIIGNAFMFLTSVATAEDTLPVVLEVLRQSDLFYDFNIGDIPYTLDPLLFILIKDNPRLLKPYLLEAGLACQFKISVLEMMGNIAVQIPETRQEIVSMAVELMEEYRKDLPQRTICDGTVTAFAIGILIDTNAVEYLPLIEELYATGLVDESLAGHIDEVRREIRLKQFTMGIPPTDPYSIRDEYRKFIQENS